MDGGLSGLVRRVFLAAPLLFTAPAFADPIIGRASVIDGDTIEIHGERIRFNGIDAPESRQLCQDAQGQDYRCGQVASTAAPPGESVSAAALARHACGSASHEGTGSSAASQSAH